MMSAVIDFKPGYIKSPLDIRDAKMPMSTSLPRVVVAKYQPPTVYNQGSTYMCVANSLASVISCIEQKQRGVNVDISRGYIYGNRLLTDYQGEGMMPREALNIVSKFGAVKNVQLPITGTYEECKAIVSQKLKELDGEGIPQRIKGYVKLSSVVDVCDFIERFEVPIIFGTSIQESFYYPVNGVIPKPLSTSPVIGGHCMTMLGTTMHDGKIKYLCQNSWGTTWGDKGKFILDPEYYTLEMWGLLPEVAEDIIKQPQMILLTLGSLTMFVDNTPTKLIAPPQVVGGKTMIPVREVAEAMGYKVGWYPMADGKSMITLTKGGEINKLDI